MSFASPGAGWRAPVLRSLFGLAFAAATLIEPIGLAANGRLDEMREELRRGASEREAAQREPSRERANDDESRLVDDLTLLALLAPFALPVSALDDDMVGAGYFPTYPYADEGRGALLLDRVAAEEGRRLSVRARGEYIFDDRNLYRIGGYVRIDTHRRFGADASAHRWRESLDDGTDRLWTGDVNVLYRFAQGEWVQFRAGGGVNWLHDQGSTNVGPNFTYQIDVYPGRPWIVSGRVDAGAIRSRAGVLRGRLMGGLMLGPAELSVGYDYYRLREFESHGPVGSVGISF